MDNQIKHAACERLQADAQLTASLIITGRQSEAHVFANHLEANASGMIQALCDAELAKDSIIRIMPDVHVGKSYVIGTSMRTRGKVAPALLGGDIGCGITAWRLKLKGKPDLNRLDKVIRTDVPSGMDIHDEFLQYLDVVDELLDALRCARHVQLDKARRSIGTLGGGNHFIELGCENSKAFWLIVHTGSRHLGTEVAEHYQKIAFAQSNDQPYDFAYLCDDALDDYLHDVQLLQRYARYNRESILRVILAGMKWKLDSGDNAVIECPHNFIEQLDENKSILLRKGAIRAGAGERIIIPMNMRDGCLICIGKGNPDWNCSAPHGAGRLMTRTDARNQFTLTRFKQEMQGIFTTCISRKTIDESPMAYKPMREIVGRITPTAEIVSTIKPLYNFKAGVSEMIYQISSGRGPAECELGVAKLAAYLLSRYPDVKMFDASDGYHRGTYRSVKIEIEADLSHLVGSVLWICKSPYRPSHGRKNWFLDVACCQTAETTAFDAEQIQFAPIRSRGKGGQNVNKVETGVRAIYLPTGDTVTCMEERTQHLNKQRAAALLRDRHEQRNAEAAANERDHDWRRHTQLKRGDASAVFVGMTFEPMTSSQKSI